MDIYKKVGSEKCFSLKETEAYAAWRNQKLNDYPRDIKDITLKIKGPGWISTDEKKSIQKICRKTNMTIVRFTGSYPDKTDLKQFGEALGLHKLDNNLCADEEVISTIRVRKDKTKHEGYIPYTEKALNWHTDGYYNLENRQINAILMYCVERAESGGGNRFLDHEVLYCQLRDLNPEFIEVLSLPDVMTIPANVVDGIEIRAEQTGPVFSFNSVTGRLHMRYSARKRNIIWKDHPVVHDAVSAIEMLLSNPNDYIFKYTPLPGQLVVSNNVLHTRTAFTDNAELGLQRVIYRARYFDRISDT